MKPHSFRQAWEAWTQANDISSPADMGVLTAEDWEAARKSLGPGSKSLLFGTSSKILDSIAQRFKQQASTSDTSRPPRQESNAPAPEHSDWTAGVSEVTKYWRIVAATRSKSEGDDSVPYTLPSMIVYVSDEGDVKVEMIGSTEDIRRALDEADADRMKETTEESKRLEHPSS
jgi:hypothetical protein